MFVPQWVLQALLTVGLLAGGWLVHDAFLASSPADPTVGVAQAAQLPPQPAAQPPQPVNVTLRIDTDDGAAPATVSGGTATTSTASTSSLAPAPALELRAAGSRPATTSSAQPRSSNAATRPSDRTAVAASSSTSSTSQHSSTIGVLAAGSHILIAMDGSIVQVGDNGVLDANTGAAQGGGVVSIDSTDSTLQTSVNGTRTTAPPAPAVPAVPAGARPGPTAPLPPAAPARPSAPGAVPAAALGGGAATSAAQAPATTAASAPPGFIGTNAYIAGYEDHSVYVLGNRNIATYDDSNVFVNRNGTINANTGDTDSSGLNAVDTVRSFISSGDHCDDGCDDESIIGAHQGHFSDDDDDDDSDSPDGDTPDEEEDSDEEEETARSLLGSTSATTTTTATTTPSHPTVIVGDGYDNVSMHVLGDDNIVTEDDSNVVVGGWGDVNMQIGDSDTGGTVTMATVDSVIRGGTSR